MQRWVSGCFCWYTRFLARIAVFGRVVGAGCCSAARCESNRRQSNCDVSNELKLSGHATRGPAGRMLNTAPGWGAGTEPPALLPSVGLLVGLGPGMQSI